MNGIRKASQLIVFSVFLLIGAGCDSDSGSNSSAYYKASEYESSYYTDYEEYEIENPYGEGSGHSAGYEWAEETGGDCYGNSDSFNEGCEEYYSQLEQADEAEESSYYEEEW